jgi:hypothetical protein
MNGSYSTVYKLLPPQWIGVRLRRNRRRCWPPILLRMGNRRVLGMMTCGCVPTGGRTDADERGLWGVEAGCGQRRAAILGSRITDPGSWIPNPGFWPPEPWSQESGTFARNSDDRKPGRNTERNPRNRRTNGCGRARP